MSTTRIKKGDTVVAIAGVGSGKTGKVMQVVSARNRAIVEGLKLVKKTLRKSQDNPQGGIVDRESPIALSNLMPYCPACKTGVKVRPVNDGGKRSRKCRKCGHGFDN